MARMIDALRKPKPVIVEKEEIMTFLPHRGRMLLLDRVIITDSKATGEFLITEEVCEGHAVVEEKSVFRGVDILEISAQLLGVVWGIRHPSFKTKKRGLLRGFGNSKFYNLVCAGDLLKVEMDPRKIRDRILGGPEEDKLIINLMGKDFLAMVEKDKKATIESVRLAII